MQGGGSLMKIEVHNRVSDYNSYRSARVKSLFNATNGCNFDLEIDNETLDNIIIDLYKNLN